MRANPRQFRWIQAQDAITSEFLIKYRSRDKLKDRLTRNNNYGKVRGRFASFMPILAKPLHWQLSRLTFEKDRRWYWLYIIGQQAHAVMYRSVTSELPDFSNQKKVRAASEVFFDVRKSSYNPP